MRPGLSSPRPGWAVHAAAGPALPVEPPATTLLMVQALAATDLLVEIEVVAVG
ncbi:MAG: hypothetical protein ACR2HA_03760 [Nocardioides sp.]